jgi:hypothetical protein
MRSLVKRGEVQSVNSGGDYCSGFATYPRRREVRSYRHSFCEELERGKLKEMVVAGQVGCGDHEECDPRHSPMI